MEEPSTESRLLSDFCDKYLHHRNVGGVGIARDTPLRGGLYLILYVKDEHDIGMFPKFHEDTPVVLLNSEWREIER